MRNDKQCSNKIITLSLTVFHWLAISHGLTTLSVTTAESKKMFKGKIQVYRWFSLIHTSSKMRVKKFKRIETSI